MRKVGIYRTRYPAPSETFISLQAAHLRRYEPLFLVRTREAEGEFRGYALSDRDFLGIRQRLFTLSASPLLFGAQQEISRLSLIHAHFGPDGLYALRLAEENDLPLVVTFHGFDATVTGQNLLRTGKVSNWRFMLSRGKLARRARCLAVSQFIRDRLVKHGFPKERIAVHHIGVNTDAFSPGGRKDTRYLLCVCRLVEKKGVDQLLQAFARIASHHPDVGLVVAGEGPERGRLLALRETLGLRRRVSFLGAVSHGEVLRLMRGAELFALAARRAQSGDSEGLGMVLNEASSCSLPVVSSLHGGIPEAVLHGETGLLSPENDVAALAEHLHTLLSDRSLALRLGQRGREYVREEFDIVRQTAKLESLYDEAMG